MIWIAGCSGMLGRELAALCEEGGISCTGTGREVDITSKDAVAAFARAVPFDWLVNCAAYTAVDKAEDEPEKCRAVNACGAENLAQEAARQYAGFISISTDYVFDGTASKPYTEDDPPDPAGVYGASKHEGEQLIRKANPAAYILRTSWLYGKYGTNFVHTMLRLMRKQETLRVVNDQRGVPTRTTDLARVILSLIARKPSPQAGVYHVSGTGECSWYEFACAIYAELRNTLTAHECRILPCSSAEYQVKAKRPAYSVLNNAKIKDALDCSIPDWKERLHQYILEINYGHTTTE